MAGRIGRIEANKEGEVGFTVYDDDDRACLFLAFPSHMEVEKAADLARSLLVCAVRCTRR